MARFSNSTNRTCPFEPTSNPHKLPNGRSFSNFSQMIESTIEGSFPITPQVPRSIGKITSQTCVVLTRTTFAQYHNGVVH
jgi:hypothetical protein